MKILFINNARGRGGGEEFLRDLLPGLVQKGIAVGLVCRPGSPLEEMFRGSGVAVHPVERSGASALTSVFSIAQIIRRGGYRIVNIQRSHDVFQSWIASLLSGARPLLLYTVQVPEFLRSRFLLGRLHGVVTISRFIREGLERYDRRLAGKTTIVYYGIDLNKFKPQSVPRGALRSRFGLAPGTPIIGTVGDLWKNQIEFLDALTAIRKIYPDARFALVASETGIGQIREFKDRAAALGLSEAVLWTGRLSKDEMMAFYRDIDIAVSTHRNEGFGIWALEAMAMGKPVVVYNAGGIRDAVAGSSAGVAVDGGPDSMAAEIVRILSDDRVRHAMEEAAPRWISTRFGRQRMIDDYEAYFRSLPDRT